LDQGLTASLIRELFLNAVFYPINLSLSFDMTYILRLLQSHIYFKPLDNTILRSNRVIRCVEVINRLSLQLFLACIFLWLQYPLDDNLTCATSNSSLDCLNRKLLWFNEKERYCQWLGDGGEPGYQSNCVWTPHYWNYTTATRLVVLILVLSSIAQSCFFSPLFESISDLFNEKNIVDYSMKKSKVRQKKCHNDHLALSGATDIVATNALNLDYSFESEFKSVLALKLKTMASVSQREAFIEEWRAVNDEIAHRIIDESGNSSADNSHRKRIWRAIEEELSDVRTRSEGTLAIFKDNNNAESRLLILLVCDLMGHQSIECRALQSLLTSSRRVSFIVQLAWGWKSTILSLILCLNLAMAYYAAVIMSAQRWERGWQWVVLASASIVCDSVGVEVLHVLWTKVVLPHSIQQQLLNVLNSLLLSSLSNSQNDLFDGVERFMFASYNVAKLNEDLFLSKFIGTHTHLYLDYFQRIHSDDSFSVWPSRMRTGSLSFSTAVKLMASSCGSFPKYLMHFVPLTMHYILHSIIISVVFYIVASSVETYFEDSKLFILFSAAATVVSVFLMLLTYYTASLLPKLSFKTFQKSSVTPISSIPNNAIDPGVMTLSIDMNSNYAENTIFSKPTTMHSPASKVVMVRQNVKNSRSESIDRRDIIHSYLDDSDEESHNNNEMQRRTSDIISKDNIAFNNALIVRDIRTTSLYELSDDEESKSSVDSLHKYMRESSSTTLLPFYYDDEIQLNVANNGRVEGEVDKVDGLNELYDLFMGQDDDDDEYRILG